MKVSVLTMTLALVLGTSWLLAQNTQTPESPKQVTLFPDGYLDHDALTIAIKKVETEFPLVVKVTSLTKTLGGRDLWLATLGHDPKVKKPAVLLVANLEADHLVGSHVALRLIEQVAAKGAGILDQVTLYVIPRLNSDGADQLLKSKPSADFRLNVRAMDRDRDGRLNEDGPDDLDGDGVITRMRAKDPKASLIADSTDPRILRKPDVAKKERPVYSDYSEGIDNDGDGQINEDPLGGVNLNRNFPHRWSEYDPEAGANPASEPATLALMKFTSEHPEIVAVWTFALADSLTTEPKKPGSTIDDADLPIFVDLSKAYLKATTKETAKAKEATKAEEKKEEPTAKTGAEAPVEKAKVAPEEKTKDTPKAKGQGGGGRGGRGPGGGGVPQTAPPAPASAPAGDLNGTTDGSLAEWAYHQLGVIGISSRLWATPEIADPAEGAAKPPADGEARWLYWNDKVVGGRAFVPLKAFDHPRLGKVEIGGWRPGVRLNPPAESIDAIAGSQLVFLKDLIGRLPKIDVKDVTVTARGAGLFEIKATVSNEGLLPTTLAQGVRVRRPGPLLVKLELGDAKILSGRPLYRVDSLAGNGGKQEYRWLILAPQGTKSLNLVVSHPKVGTTTSTIELK